MTAVEPIEIPVRPYEIFKEKSVSMGAQFPASFTRFPKVFFYSLCILTFDLDDSSLF